MLFFQLAKNKGADQTERMRRLLCALVVRKPPKRRAHLVIHVNNIDRTDLLKMTIVIEILIIASNLCFGHFDITINYI